MRSARLAAAGVLVAVALVTPARPADELPRADARRLEARVLALGRFGANAEGGVTRVAFGPADVDGRAYVSSLMRAVGLAVRIDAAGNILGRRQGRETGLPVILFGSHIDSVPGGGNYDGVAGVLGAIECVELLNAAVRTTRHPLEVVVFADEEGSLAGSRAMADALGEEALAETSHSGLTVREGIRAIGGDPERLASARRRPSELRAFLELHVEQGGILDAKGLDIGVVLGIVGINWWDVTVEGIANHAGTTPMDRRKDALVAAAQLVLAVNRVVTAVPGSQVGTVGRIAAAPGAPNVIPGRVEMSLELRDLSAGKIAALFAAVEAEARTIAATTGTRISFRPVDATALPALTDERIRRLIAAAADALGLRHTALPSGAGHDAQDLARVTPTGMVFVPSAGGISHSPKEYTSPEQVARGVDVLLRTILAIDAGALD
ncbi:MAG TPA: Zn-dependent hydrolase [Vicinamibacteria bacterium]|nr:Zn-dependent hydrolase [Vicinamibacteria bacterium]